MSGTLSPWPVVQNGNQGHPILTLQFLLRAHGHNLAVDGMFGPATESAVKAFKPARA
jgi:peptidoglycan hydrolase-like protein with peptidoglycan-binding domain